MINRQIIIAMLVLILMIITISIASATITCSPSSITTSYNEGDSKQVSTTCQNDGNSTTISITGETQIISTTETDFNMGQKTISIDLSSIALVGLHSGTLLFGTGYSVPIFFEVISTQPPNNPGDISFPTTKIINVQQGEIKNTKVTLILPSNYPNPINIVAIEFSEESGIVSFGDVETGIVNPGTSKDIPLIVDATNAAVGQYPQIEVKVRYDEEGIYELSSRLDIRVTSNLNPITGDTFSTKPSCALSSTDMNLNSTHTLTCSGVVNNLEVNPQYNQYFEGISVDTTSNIFTYTFKPVKFGNTDFLVLFSYKGSPIFSPFTSDVRIRSTSGVSPGTNLKFLFTPSLDKAQNGEVVAIQLLDNSTDSLVDLPSIEVNAIPITNKSGSTFFYAFKVGETYTLRGTTEGYLDLVQTINISSTPIEIIISPSEGTAMTQFNITTDVNATIFIDGVNKNNLFEGTLDSGEHTIEAFKEGYLDAKINFTVLSTVLIVGDGAEFKKGAEQTFTLNKNVSWKVSYQKDIDSVIEQLHTGDGDLIVFEPTKKGTYVIEAGDAVKTLTIEGWNWNKKWWFMAWYWWVIIVGIGIFVYSKYVNSETTTGTDIGFAGKPRV